MENENKQMENNKEEVGLTRQQKIENFLLNPDKEIFNSLQEFNDSINYIKSLLGNLDLNDLEKLQGEDGKSPELGIDYLTDDDLDKIDNFINDRVKESWSSFPTVEQLNASIESKIASEVAKIPSKEEINNNISNRVSSEVAKIPKAKDGSPDTAEQILAKLRSLDKNKRINVSDIRGLQAELNRIAQEGESSIEDLRTLVESFRITIPATNSGGISNITGLIEEGSNISITGSGTLDDPFVINAVGMGLGDVVGPAVAVNENIAVFDNTTGKLIKDGGKKISDLELVANKSTNVITDGASDIKYPSVKAIKDYADSLVTGLLDYRGAYDSSVNTFPASGGSGSAGAVMKGDMWIISVAGTLGSVAVQIGDSVISNVDTPGQTASNWNILNSNIAYVPEDVANKKTTMSGNTASDTFYLSAKAIYDWAVALFAPLRPTATKTTLVDADEVTGNDSADSFGQIKTTWTNVKAFLKTYFDGLYATTAQGTLATNALPKAGGSMTGSLNESKGTDIPSATTTDIGAATGNFVDVTGTTTITGLGTVQAGTERTVRFTGILLLTHNATSLILPTGANITTQAGDTAIFRSLGSGNWVCVSYLRKDGTALVAVTASSTTTFTNKRINPRLVTAASYTTDTGTSLDVSTCDQFEVTAQAGALLFNSPGGTPLGGNKLIIRIKDNGTARALTWNAIFRPMGNALPTTTVISKTLYCGFEYNATDTKWDLIALTQEA